jgi:hypothetical protein
LIQHFVLNADTGCCWMNLLHPFLHFGDGLLHLPEWRWVHLANVTVGLHLFCHCRWWASSDCTLLEFHFLVHLALAVLRRYFPVVFPNFTHRNSLPLVPLSICIIGFFINLCTVPCLMNGCHLYWSSFFMPAVVPPGLTCHHYIWTCCHCSWLVCILWFMIHIAPSRPWWPPRRLLDGLLTDCMLLHLRAQLARWPFLLSDVTVRLGLVSVFDIMVGLDSFSLLRTV